MENPYIIAVAVLAAAVNTTVLSTIIQGHIERQLS